MAHMNLEPQALSIWYLHQPVLIHPTPPLPGRRLLGRIRISPRYIPKKGLFQDTPNYRFRHPKDHLLKTRRAFSEGHCRVPVHALTPFRPFCCNSMLGPESESIQDSSRPIQGTEVSAPVAFMVSNSITAGLEGFRMRGPH